MFFSSFCFNSCFFKNQPIFRIFQRFGAVFMRF